MMGVVIHEVGTTFPNDCELVNANGLGWMRGLNSFMEFMAEQKQGQTFPRSPAKNIVPYMSGDQKFLEPIMSKKVLSLVIMHTGNRLQVLISERNYG
jgi:hypothetical protein